MGVVLAHTPVLPTEEVWSALRSKEEEIRPLFREGLAVVEGSLLRSSGFDGGLCRLAGDAGRCAGSGA